MAYLGQLVWEGGVPVATDVAPPGTPPPAVPGDPGFTGPVDTNPQPGDPNFTGPVQSSTDTTYTLPVEIFNGVLPPIVIQTGGAPTIPSPIPTTLPTTTTPAPAPTQSNTAFWVILAAVGAILFSPSKKKRR